MIYSLYSHDAYLNISPGGRFESPASNESFSGLATKSDYSNQVLAGSTFLKIANFNGNAKSGEPSYLSVTVPNALKYAEEMAADHSADDIIVKMGGKADGVPFEEELIRANYETVQKHEGAQSSSMILVGHKQVTNPAPKGVVLSGISYIETDADGTRRVRCNVHPGIKAGDQAYLSENDFFTIGAISYQVGVGGASMEISE